MRVGRWLLRIGSCSMVLARMLREILLVSLLFHPPVSSFEFLGVRDADFAGMTFRQRRISVPGTTNNPIPPPPQINNGRLGIPSFDFPLRRNCSSARVHHSFRGVVVDEAIAAAECGY